jgi:hypothetical protein
MLTTILRRWFSRKESWPTTTLRCWLKQVQASQISQFDGQRAQKIFDLCFPEFQSQSRIFDFLESARVMVTTSKGSLPTGGRIRRFAGDRTLPGGRYHAVCSNQSGDDGGTLVWELMSYWTGASKVFPNLKDSTIHIPQHVLHEMYKASLAFKPDYFLILSMSIRGNIRIDSTPNRSRGCHKECY